MSNMTSLEYVLAESLREVTKVDIVKIIEAAQAACIGGCTPTVAEGAVEVVVTPTVAGSANNNAGTQPAKRTKTQMKEVVPTKPIEATTQEIKEANYQPTPEPVVEKPAPVEPAVTKEPPAGIDLSGLFVGTGADRKVVKDVFLAAVEKAKNVATLAALNATCDCGFATGDYTDNEMEVLRRKLKRWGAAQE